MSISTRSSKKWVPSETSAHQVLAHRHDLAQHRHGVDFREGDGHAQLRRGGAPASRTEQHDAADFLHGLVVRDAADEPGDAVAVGDGHPAVHLGHDVDEQVHHVGAALPDNRPARSAATMSRSAHVRRQRHRHGVAAHLERAALHQVDAVVAVQA